MAGIPFLGSLWEVLSSMFDALTTVSREENALGDHCAMQRSSAFHIVLATEQTPLLSASLSSYSLREAQFRLGFF